MRTPARPYLLAEILTSATRQLGYTPGSGLLIQGLVRTTTPDGPAMVPGPALLIPEGQATGPHASQVATQIHAAMAPVLCGQILAAVYTDNTSQATSMTSTARDAGYDTWPIQVTQAGFRELHPAGRLWPRDLLREVAAPAHRPRLGRPEPAPGRLLTMNEPDDAWRDLFTTACQQADAQVGSHGPAHVGAIALRAWRDALGGTGNPHQPESAAAIATAADHPRLRDALILAAIPDTGRLPERLAAGRGIAKARDVFTALSDRTATPCTGRRLSRGLELLGWLAASREEGCRAPLLTIGAYLADAAGDLDYAQLWADSAYYDDPNDETARLLQRAIVNEVEERAAAPTQAPSTGTSGRAIS